MTTPLRIQLSRRKGFSLPENTVVVSRPSKFGNPFKVGSHTHELPFIVCKRMTGELDVTLSQAQAVEAFYIWLNHMARGTMLADSAKMFLRGKNLACWCKLCPKHKDGLPLGEKCEGCAPCHATLLLEIANQ